MNLYNHPDACSMITFREYIKIWRCSIYFYITFKIMQFDDSQGFKSESTFKQIMARLSRGLIAGLQENYQP